MAGYELPPEWNDLIRRLRQYQIPPALADAIITAREFRPSPQLMDTVTLFTAQAREAVMSAQQVFSSNVAPTLAKWSLHLPAIEAWVAEYGPMIVDFAERARSLWRSALAPNWLDLEPSEVTEVIRRVRETGFALVWIPRVEIVREVLGAKVADTALVLLARRDDVLDDAAACLAEVDDPSLSLHRSAAEEAILALRDGHEKAAQALASSVFTSEIHVLFEMGTKAIRKRMADEDPEDAEISQMRLRTIFAAGARALAEFRPDKARPLRREFNRHNTAHRLTPEQWTEANALSAIMLATSLLREMNYWFTLQRNAPDASA